MEAKFLVETFKNFSRMP